MEIRSFASCLKELLEKNDPKFEVVSSVVGKAPEELSVFLDNDDQAERLLSQIQTHTFAGVYQLFAKNYDEIVEFARLSEGARQALLKIEDHTSVENLANKLGVSHQNLSRHLKGSRYSSNVEEKILSFLNQKQQTVSRKISNGHQNIVGLDVGVEDRKPEKIVILPGCDIAIFLAQLLTVTGNTLHDFVFVKSSPETRALLRERMGASFEKMRLAYMALGSETIFKDVIEHHPQLKQGRDNK